MNTKPNYKQYDIEQYALREDNIIKTERTNWIDFYAASYDKVLNEAVFCVLTPQSKALSADSAIKSAGSIHNLTPEILSQNGVRFHNDKFKRVKILINNFNTCYSAMKNETDNIKLRNYLANSIAGYGLKESSHFMRNVGRGNNIAIIDRHILNAVLERGLIDKIPRHLNKSAYFEIEKMITKYADEISIPHSHLDMLWWSYKSGVFFK